jgi:hypothetical protein
MTEHTPIYALMLLMALSNLLAVYLILRLIAKLKRGEL